jgi:hypothetical protein
MDVIQLIFTVIRQGYRIAALALVLLVFQANGQETVYTPMHDIQVTLDGQSLAFPLTGGLEAPQFAAFHLNADPLADLLIFDRIGGKLLPFLAIQSEGSVHYSYAPEYEAAFPKIHQLLQLRDLNCDGLDDIITTRTFGPVAAEVVLTAYLQESPLTFSDRIDFHLMDNPADSLIRIHAFDIPSLADINGDERIDLLYIPIGGTQIQYYENISPPDDCETMAFTLADDCWGKAVYTLNANFELQACDSEPSPVTGSSGCAGSVMLNQDIDYDGDQDLYFSGLNDEIILQLSNGGDNHYANLVSQQDSWLYDGQPLLKFPAPFFLDLYHDGQPDLIVATNGIGGLGNSPDGHLLYHFVKPGPSEPWQMQDDKAWLKDMIDLGFRSSPAVWDVNLDGLPDLLIAYNQPHPTFSHAASIAYFTNVGTPEAPAFELTDTDFAGLSEYIYKSMHPTFSDLNADGLPELIIGLENGKVEVFTNIAEGTDAYVRPSDQLFGDFVFNGFARPQAVDLSMDGKPDLIVGTKNGTISYLENTGSTTQPAFNLITDTLAGIYPNAYFQECSVFAAEHDENTFDLYYAQRNGTTALYRGNVSSGFNLINASIDAIDVGERATLCLADLNNDNAREIIFGNMRGGVEIFSPEQVSATHAVSSRQESIFLFPNPCSGPNFTVQTPLLEHKAMLVLFNTAGQTVARFPLQKGIQSHLIEATILRDGLYFYQIRIEEEVLGGKFIMSRSKN